MKLILNIVVLLFCQNVFCQQYHFDGFIEYKGGINNPGRSAFYFYNSNDETYRLWVSERFGGIYGAIKDTKNQIIHEYEVINDANSIKFNYQSSRKWIQNENSQDYFYDIIKKEIDSTKSEVKILIYRTKKKKKIWYKIDLIIDNSELISNESIFLSYVDGPIHNKKFEGIRGIPISIKIDYRNGAKSRHTLIRRKKINTVLTVDNIILK